MASTKTGAIGTGNAASLSAFGALENGRGPTDLVGPLSSFFLVVAVTIVVAGFFVALVALVALVGLLDHRLLVGRLGHDRLGHDRFRRGLLFVGLVAIGLVDVLTVLVGVLFDQSRVRGVGAASVVVLTAGRRRRRRRWRRRCGRREVGGQTGELHLQVAPAVGIGQSHPGQRLAGIRGENRDGQHVQDGGPATHRRLRRGFP